jgi:Tfp pilus assembly protein PilF
MGLFAGCAFVQPSAQDQEVRARMDLASSYLANDQPRRALRQLKALQDRAVKNPDYHYLYGLTSARLERNSEAKKHFQEAVNLRPDFGQAWNNLGKVYISLHCEEKARQAFVQALHIPTYLTPEYPAYNLARLNVECGRPEQAEEWLRQSLQANPGFVPTILLLSKLLTADERLHEAVDVVRRGLNIHPDNVALMQDLAQNFLRLGQHEQARQWFERIARKADPRSKAAQMAEDYLELLPG